jgi:hypothetical protein
MTAAAFGVQGPRRGDQTGWPLVHRRIVSTASVDCSPVLIAIRIVFDALRKGFV